MSARGSVGLVLFFPAAVLRQRQRAGNVGQRRQATLTANSAIETTTFPTPGMARRLTRAAVSVLLSRRDGRNSPPNKANLARSTHYFQFHPLPTVLPAVGQRMGASVGLTRTMCGNLASKMSGAGDFFEPTFSRSGWTRRRG
jgi:hypothetical protein